MKCKSGRRREVNAKEQSNFSFLFSTFCVDLVDLDRSRNLHTLHSSEVVVDQDSELLQVLGSKREEGDGNLLAVEEACS